MFYYNQPSERMREKVIVIVLFVCLSVCVQQISKVAALQQSKQHDREEDEIELMCHFFLILLLFSRKSKKHCAV